MLWRTQADPFHTSENGVPDDWASTLLTARHQLGLTQSIPVASVTDGDPLPDGVAAASLLHEPPFHWNAVTVVTLPGWPKYVPSVSQTVDETHDTE